MKVVRRSLAALATFGALFLLNFLFVVYPNDARIDGPYDVSHGPRAVSATRVVSLLQDSLPHILNVDDSTLKLRLEEAKAVLPDTALFASKRFTSPYQVYLPIGSYPARLEARDGVFIPAGSTLTIEPGVVGHSEVRFGLFGVGGAAAVTVGVLGQASPVLSVEFAPRVRPNWLPPGIARYVTPDQAARTDRWADGRAQIALAKHDQVAITCKAKGVGCLVSDVRFDQAESPRQNFVVIVVDTLRGDGPAGGHAPNIQRFAAQSTVFNQALAPGNMTSPSTNALLACITPSRLGSLAFAYAVNRDKREAFYDGGHLSFPAQFARAGYETAMIGNVSVISEIYGVGVNHGFVRQIAMETDGYDTPQIAREAVQWLDENGDRPFLLYLHFNGPHAPYRAPLTDVLSAVRGFTSFRSYPDMLYTLYQGEIRYTDRYLAKVFKALDDLNLSERTTVVLTADHGDQHEIRPFTHNVAGPDIHGAYFDHGATLLNDEIRVPLMVRRPGGVALGVDGVFVSTLDVGPTLLDLAGVRSAGDHDPRNRCDGRSLAGILTGEPVTAAFKTIGSEGFRGRAIVFDNRYKYIKTYTPTDKRMYDRSGWAGPMRLYMAPEQLFDLASDPDELRDLAGENLPLLERARTEYRTFYEVKDAVELVIDNPEGAEVEATYAHVSGLTPEALSVVEGQGEVTATAQGGVRLHGGNSRRFLIRTELAGIGTPTVRIAGQDVPVTFSSMHLPLRSGVSALPAEPAGMSSIPPLGRQSLALLRRVQDDGQEGRVIVAGNPKFDQVLREWGYLNDR